jgi:hypothetical protein
VAEMHEVNWDLELRRYLGQEEALELEELQEAVEVVQITDAKDELIWALEASSKFTSKSLYRLMINPGEVATRMKDLWEVKMPLKIKVFLWMLWHNRVQTGEKLKIRKSKHS